MGGAIKSIGTAVLGGPAALIGSKLAPKLGLGLDDEQGAYATPEQKQQKQYQDYMANYDKNMGEATKGVQEGAMTKGLFGEGGLQSQLGTEGSDLASRGYSLTQGDREAYGQTAGDVSRMFGQQDQAATAQLARRGLGAGASGAAGAQFSGIQGNKNEMLAQAQTSIAQKRMADTNQRLQQNRVMQSQLAGQGVGMAKSNFADKGSALGAAAGVEGNINNQARQTLADQQAAVKPGLFSTIGQGLQRGVGQMAQAAPGMLVGGMGGGAASAGGGQMAGLYGQGGGAEAGSALGTPNQTFSMMPSKRGGNYGNIV